MAVGDACSREVVSLRATQSLAEVREWLAAAGATSRHQGFPVLGDDDQLTGVVTRRDLLDANQSGELLVGALLRRPALVVREDHTLREAADHMVEADVGRLVVMGGAGMRQMVGIITRGDLLAAHAGRLREARRASRHIGGSKAA